MVSQYNLSSTTHSKESLPFDVKFQTSPDGKSLQVDFCDLKADYKDFYDTTRLVMNKEPYYMDNHKIYNCAVSWYGSDDRHILDPNTNRIESPRAIDYKGVLMEINPDLLMKDPNYCYIVMKGLLNKNRVGKYLEQGLTENPQIPCGNYIGGIGIKNNMYSKVFSKKVGLASHNSPSMKNRRLKHKELIEKIKRIDKNIQNER